MKRFAGAALIAALCAVLPAAALETPARTAILVDYDTGAILFEKDADKQIPPASMSKLMTAEVVFSKLKSGEITLDTKFRVSQTAWSMQGSKMFTDINEEIRVEDLLRGVIVQSGNDACIVLAEGVAGSEAAFADLMNARARELGLANSFFVNATGWPADGHLTTARDLATLARHIIKAYPEYFHYYAEKEFTWHGIKQGNRNPLLYATPPGDGLKTGHTEEAGYGLVGTQERNGQRIIMVVSGLSSMDERAAESVRVMEQAFKEFRRYRVAEAGAVLGEVPVWNGDRERVGLAAGETADIYMTAPVRQGVKARLVYSAPLIAPVAKGQKAGEMIVEIPGQAPRSIPLVAADDVMDAGFFSRILNGLHLMFGGAPPPA